MLECILIFQLSPRLYLSRGGYLTIVKTLSTEAEYVYCLRNDSPAVFALMSDGVSRNERSNKSSYPQTYKGYLLAENAYYFLKKGRNV